jgi:putative ABC transport system permease protein
MIGKLLVIVMRDIGRQPMRTALTAGAFAVAMFSYTVLIAVSLTVDRITNHASKSLRLIVTERNSTRAARTDWSTTLPIKYCDQILKMPHVSGCAPVISWGGFYRDPRNIIMASAINAEPVAITTISDYQIPAKLMTEFMSDRRNAMVGTNLMHEHHWKLGEVVSLRDAEMPARALTFVPVVELPAQYLSRAFWFNARLLDAKNYYATPWIENRAAFMVVRVDAAENMGSVADTIDNNFHNSEAETQTNTESDSVAGVIGEITDAKAIIYGLCLAILITVLLVSANSMAMMVHDHLGQVAVMRALGFQRAHIATLLLGEATLIGLAGALIGAFAALFMFGNPTSLGPITGMMGYVQVLPENAIAAICIAVFISLAAAITPSLNATLIVPALALRKVI